MLPLDRSSPKTPWLTNRQCARYKPYLSSEPVHVALHRGECSHTHTYTYSQAGEEIVGWGLVISQWSGDTSASVSTEHVACFPRVTSTKPTALLCFLSRYLKIISFVLCLFPNRLVPASTLWSDSKVWILFFIRYLLSLENKFWVLPFTMCLIWSLQ